MRHNARTIRLIRPALAAVFCIGLLGMVGCNDATVTREQVLSDYDNRRYSSAFEGAETLTRRASGPQRDELAMVAGMSAYHLGRNDAALKHLVRLTQRHDDTMAGRAGATVGLIYARLGRDEQAAAAFASAAPRLTGNDQAMAYYHAATAQQRMGRWASSRSNLTLAQAFASDASLRAAIRQRQRTDSFAVQFGAFQSPDTAARHSRAMRGAALRAGLGEPAVVTSVTEEGKTLYLVQAGRFTAKGPAIEARRRTAISSAFVVPAVSR